MKEFLKKKSRTVEFIVSVLIIYICIKIINNYQYFFNGLNSLYNILTPFIFAFIFAYVLNPVMKLFERKLKLNRKISIALTYVSIIACLVLIGFSLIPKIYNNLIDISRNLPSFITDIQEWGDSVIAKNKVFNEIANNVHLDPNMIFSKAKDLLGNGLNVMLTSTLSFTSSFIKVLLGFLISIYVLYDKEKFINVGKKSIFLLFREKWGRRIVELIKNIHRLIGAYIGIKALDSLIIGIIAFVGLSIFKCKYSIIVAIIVGITNMIPYFGPFIGMVTGFLVNIFFNPITAFAVFIFLFALQQFDAWFLDPKLIGNRVGLSPYFVILAVSIGGGFYGPIGMILAVPVMAVLKLYWFRIIDKIESLYNKGIRKKDAK